MLQSECLEAIYTINTFDDKAVEYYVIFQFI